jgi:hypothetical protein
VGDTDDARSGTGDAPRICGGSAEAWSANPNAREQTRGQFDRARPLKPSGRAVKLDERASVELRRLGSSDRFVVWRVRVLG